ncbi:MAG: dienelactone hydrolase family protein [Planctomycetota bacterium]|nr:dienelactone hydrolase family protein [Planctomycetota bacterium]
MTAESLRIPVPHAGAEWVSALLDLPEEDPGKSVVLLAHGAGAPMTSDFMVAAAEGLAAGGLPVLRFNYVFTELAQREGRRRPPERQPRLLETHRAAAAAIRERFPERRLILAGKSMGGRMSSYLAAEGDDCAGLVFFGYPLHPAGKPEKLRSEHFAAIAQPALFLQGTRDALCGLDLLERELETFGGTQTVEVIDEGDHDFGVPRRTGRTRDEVRAALLEKVLDWEQATWP